MDRNYWEKIAPGYSDEIFDVLHNDKKAVIRSVIEQLASPRGRVIDVGCAIGKWLPVLSPAFRQVMAVDISARNLQIAQRQYPHLTNVEYRRVDMSARKTSFTKYDVAVCINAVLTDSLKKRNLFFYNLAHCLKRGGHLVLVVPSLESWLLTRIVQHRWKIDKDLFNDKLPGKEGLKRYKQMQQGNVEIDNVATKHYLADELGMILKNEGFSVLRCTKIEYDWRTEFIHPPPELTEPHPWDWMVVAQKGNS